MKVTLCDKCLKEMPPRIPMLMVRSQPDKADPWVWDICDTCESDVLVLLHTALGPGRQLPPMTNKAGRR